MAKGIHLGSHGCPKSSWCLISNHFTGTTQPFYILTLTKSVSLNPTFTFNPASILPRFTLLQRKSPARPCPAVRSAGTSRLFTPRPNDLDRSVPRLAFEAGCCTHCPPPAPPPSYPTFLPFAFLFRGTQPLLSWHIICRFIAVKKFVSFLDVPLPHSMPPQVLMWCNAIHNPTFCPEVVQMSLMSSILV